MFGYYLFSLIQALIWDVRWRPVPRTCHYHPKTILPNPFHNSISTEVVVSRGMRMLYIDTYITPLISFYHSLQRLHHHPHLHVSHDSPISWERGLIWLRPFAITVALPSSLPAYSWPFSSSHTLVTISIMYLAFLLSALIKN